MKGIAITACGLVLLGCAKEQPASHIIADNAVDTVSAIQQSLPKECKTDSNELLFTVAKREIRNITTQCNTEKAEITRDKLKWKLSFWALIGVVAAYILRKILK